MRLGSSFATSIFVAGAALALALGSARPAFPQVTAKAWKATFKAPVEIKSAGAYTAEGEPDMHFESFSALCLEPSATALFRVQNTAARTVLSPGGTPGQVVFQDDKPALRANPAGPPFYTRAEGAISAFAWVPGQFSDVKLTAEVNTTGGAGGKGSTSRQGVMGRWDQGNNHYWFYVNFASGTYGIVRSRFFGVLMQDLPGSAGPIADFQNTKPYYLEFELKGATAHGRVYEQSASGRRLVGDTGVITDKDPFKAGVSGVLIEKWIDSPFDPLEGSFANLTSTPLR
jgi:hypothetical protein